MTRFMLLRSSRTIGDHSLNKGKTHSLFERVRIGNLTAANRIVMSSLVRARSVQPGCVPNELVATHYAQRSSAGLIVSEGTHVNASGNGCYGSPGIFTAAQMAGWQQVSRSVREEGGHMFLQLVHAGRQSHTTLTQGIAPVAPSAIVSASTVWTKGELGKTRLVPCSHPRAMYLADIESTISDFGNAAFNACRLGFDGVEIDSGSGALLEQFLRSSSNVRKDHYGGSAENRIRFVRELVQCVADRIGVKRVGVRVSPFIAQRSGRDADYLKTILLLVRELNRLGVAYVHVSESNGVSAPYVDPAFRASLRSSFSGVLILGGYYSGKSGQSIVDQGFADAVSFGRAFVANPDLPSRLENNLPLAKIINPFTLRGGGAYGYTDYPVFGSAEAIDS